MRLIGLVLVILLLVVIVVQLSKMSAVRGGTVQDAYQAPAVQNAAGSGGTISDAASSNPARSQSAGGSGAVDPSQSVAQQPATGSSGQQRSVAPAGADFCVIAGQTFPLSYGSNRIYISDPINQRLKQSGGHCEVDLGSETTFVYDSVEGRLQVDGRLVPNGNDKVVTGRTFAADYSPNDGSNGFDLKLRG